MNLGDGALLPMSTMLQTRCNIGVERREPMRVVPACVLEDMVSVGVVGDGVRYCDHLAIYT